MCVCGETRDIIYEDVQLKGACSFRRERLTEVYVVINKISKLSSFSRLNKTDLKGQHSFILFYFVYMWRTLPPF